MLLHVIGSSSSGNAYALESKNETLLLECGVRFQSVKKALNFNVSKIVGCLITHEHLDHSKHIKSVLDSGIDVFASLGTIRATKIIHHRLSRARHGVTFMCGEFTIKPFDIKHDCAEGLGYLINHPDMGNVLFMTDSYFVEYKFPKLNNLIIEANYAEDILQENINSGRVNPVVASRVRSSHMELGTLKELLLANDLSQVNNIVLIHLSDGNSDAKRFAIEIIKLTGKTTIVADRNMTIPFEKYPF